jgi:hypothetical protein
MTTLIGGCLSLSNNDDDDDDSTEARENYSHKILLETPRESACQAELTIGIEAVSTVVVQNTHEHLRAL